MAAVLHAGEGEPGDGRDHQGRGASRPKV